METTNPALDLLFDLDRVHGLLLKRVDAQLSPHGISFTEFRVMHQLSLAPNLTLRRVELAAAVGLSASGVTRLLLPMEKIGLVAREANPRDARVSLVRLTDAGQGILADARVSVRQAAEGFLASLTTVQGDQMRILPQNLG